MKHRSAILTGCAAAMWLIVGSLGLSSHLPWFVVLVLALVTVAASVSLPLAVSVIVAWPLLASASALLTLGLHHHVHLANCTAILVLGLAGLRLVTGPARSKSLKAGSVAGALILVAVALPVGVFAAQARGAATSNEVQRVRSVVKAGDWTSHLMIIREMAASNQYGYDRSSEVSRETLSGFATYPQGVHESALVVRDSGISKRSSSSVVLLNSLILATLLWWTTGAMAVGVAIAFVLSLARVRPAFQVAGAVSGVSLVLFTPNQQLSFSVGFVGQIGGVALLSVGLLMCVGASSHATEGHRRMFRVVASLVAFGAINAYYLTLPLVAAALAAVELPILLSRTSNAPRSRRWLVFALLMLAPAASLWPVVRSLQAGSANAINATGGIGKLFGPVLAVAVVLTAAALLGLRGRFQAVWPALFFPFAMSVACAAGVSVVNKLHSAHGSYYGQKMWYLVVPSLVVGAMSCGYLVLAMACRSLGGNWLDYLAWLMAAVILVEWSGVAGVLPPISGPNVTRATFRYDNDAARTAVFTYALAPEQHFADASPILWGVNRIPADDFLDTRILGSLLALPNSATWWFGQEIIGAHSDAALVTFAGRATQRIVVLTRSADTCVSVAGVNPLVECRVLG